MEVRDSYHPLKEWACDPSIIYDQLPSPISVGNYLKKKSGNLLEYLETKPGYPPGYWRGRRTKIDGGDYKIVRAS